MDRIRVCAVLTHPVQYYAPWFRWIHANCRDLDLHVIYASSPTRRQQGTGFDREFVWDVPLTDGYECTVVRAARPADRFDSEHFWGLNVPEIADAIAGRRPDVVVVFGWYSVTLVRAIAAARRLKIPLLYHGDTNLSSGPAGWRRALWVAKTRRLLSCFSGYLSVGIRSAAFLRFFGVPDGLIFATPHAVDNDRFSEAASLRACASRRADTRRRLALPADVFVVLFAGKLEPKKRPLDLVETLGIMHPRPHLAIAGAGALEADVREAAARLGVGCSMLGFVNQSEMLRVYAAADCLALPSDTRETWGLVVNEALAAGLPCVVADTVGCAPDLGGPETGGVYPTEEPELNGLVNEFAAALSSVRDRLQAGHDFTAACQSLVSTRSFEQATAGLALACRTVNQATAAPARPQTGKNAGLRVVACCGGMVLVGGLERMTFEILRVLRDKGAVVHCIVNSWDHWRIVAMAEQLGASWSTGYYWYRFTRRTRNPLTAARIVWDTLCTSAGLLRHSWWFRASHILVSDYVTAVRNAPALLLLKLSGRRVVLRLGNAPDQGRFYRWVWRWGVNPFVDVFVCNSRFTEQELAALGIPAAKRITIPHTPPTRRSAGSRAESRDLGRVIYVGTIIPGKGLDLLIDAIALLVGRGCDVRLDVVGRFDGWVPPEYEPYRAALLERAARPDLASRVRFLGDRDDVPQLMAASAIHCCPSRVALREGFGIVVIEAKQAGIPSVVMPSGALTELIAHGKDGWVCREETPAALAEGLEYFLDADRLAPAMKAARASASTFSRDRFERAWGAVFLEAS
jgi:glycosyltransferase involved in cell wall biosynthesis